MSDLWSTVIAVAGTLAGGLLAGGVQGRVAVTARREARGDARWADVLTAVTSLVVALADHRRAMWVLEHHRLSGADRQVVVEARATSLVTRSAVTAPLTTVNILAPAVEPAKAATKATYALHDASTHDILAALRVDALEASDQFVDAVAGFFAAHGGVVGVAR